MENEKLRIAQLEVEVRDLRQRLIGGCEGVLAGPVRAEALKRWAEANNKWLHDTAPRIANYCQNLEQERPEHEP